MRGLCWVRFFVYVVVVSVFTSPLLQADVTGSIFGTVTDPSGAVISAARVTLSNLDTGLSRNTLTDSIGSYQFLTVPVGENYVVEVQAKGFEPAFRWEAVRHLHQIRSAACGRAALDWKHTRLQAPVSH